MIKYEYNIIYRTVEEMNDFIRDIDEAMIKYGWQCKGGVAVSFVNGTEWMYQAMIREVKDDDSQYRG